MCLSSKTIWGNWNHGAIQQIILRKSTKFHGNGTDVCHSVESIRLGETRTLIKQFCSIVGICGKSVLFTRDMACTPCKEKFLSSQQRGQTEVHLFFGWWNDNYWDQSDACSEVHKGTVYCSCRTDCNVRRCLCLYCVQTNVPMWHLLHDGLELMPFYTLAFPEFFIYEHNKILYILPVLIRLNSTYYLVL